MASYATTLFEKSALVWWQAQCISDPTIPTWWEFERDLMPALQKAFKDLGHEERILTAM